MSTALLNTSSFQGDPVRAQLHPGTIHHSPGASFSGVLKVYSSAKISARKRPVADEPTRLAQYNKPALTARSRQARLRRAEVSTGLHAIARIWWGIL